MWAPGPTAVPLTAATVGLSSSHSSRTSACTPTRNASAVVRGSNSGVPALVTVESRRSMPAQNASPAPVSSTARTSASCRPLRTKRTSSSRISTVREFFASGRFSVIASTPSASSHEMFTCSW